MFSIIKPLRKKRLRDRSRKGITLLETVLALAIGGMVVTGGIVGMQNYNTEMRIKTSAVLIGQVTRAVDLYVNDNYADVVGAGKRSISIDDLQPYLGVTGTPKDPFGNIYEIYKRTVPYTVEENGVVRNLDAIQVLVISRIENDIGARLLGKSPINRIRIANEVGPGAGYFYAPGLPCGDVIDENGNTVSSSTFGSEEDAFCGVYGTGGFTEQLLRDEFGVTIPNQSAYGTLTVVGDSSVYGDQLYRKDLGDPDLNTMRTNLLMNPDTAIASTTRDSKIELAAPEDTRSGRGFVQNSLMLKSDKHVVLESDRDVRVNPERDYLVTPGENATIQAGQRVDLETGPTSGMDLTSGRNINLRAASNVNLEAENNIFLRPDQDTGAVIIGGRRVLNNADIGQADLRARDINARYLTANQITHTRGDPSADCSVDDEDCSTYSALKLQRFSGGTVIVGAGDRKEADGLLAAGDFMCTECGGTLSEILPKYRHMDTFMIESHVRVNGYGSPTSVPKPECASNHSAKIIVTPRTISKTARISPNDDREYPAGSPDAEYWLQGANIEETSLHGEGAFDFKFYARNNGRNWDVYATGIRGTSATALASTYCAFNG